MIRWMRKGCRGQSMVETALVMPLILLILTGIVDFGLVFNHYMIINNAVREGARAAVVGSTDAQVRTIINSMTTSLDPADMTTTITPPQASRQRGTMITVSISYNNNLITPILSRLLTNVIRINASSVMRIE